jgi:hypothetical protein
MNLLDADGVASLYKGVSRKETLVEQSRIENSTPREEEKLLRRALLLYKPTALRSDPCP